MKLFCVAVLNLLSAGIGSGQSYTIATLSGGGVPANVPGNTAFMGGFPMSYMARDPDGNLVFSYENTVMRLNPSTGMISIVAGTGAPGYLGDNGPATLAQFNKVYGLAFDAAGSLYLADSGNNRIRKITNGTIATIAGTGVAGFGGDQGPALSASMNSPRGLAVDTAGNIYFADRLNNRVRMISNGVITTVAGSGVRDYGGESGTATSMPLDLPSGVAVDAAGNIYISDFGNGLIRKVTKGIMTTFAGRVRPQGDPLGDNGPATGASIVFPTQITVDGGSLYIAQSGRIRKIANGIITTVAGTGKEEFSGDGGPATAAGLNDPLGVALDTVGNLYISDAQNYRIRKVANGIVSTVVGTGPRGFFGNFGPAANAEFSYPLSVALDAAGNLYFSAKASNRVFRISKGVISCVAGNGNAAFGGDGGPAENASLNQPRGIALDLRGNLYIADSDNNRVRMVSNGVITTVAGSGIRGYSGDGGSATAAGLSAPNYLAVDAAGNLYFSDVFTNVIRRVSNNVITTIAGTGISGFSGDKGPAVKAQLFGPQGLALDTSGNLYFSDGGNRRIRKIANGIITTVAGDGGISGFGGDNGPALKAQFNNAMGLALDAAGAIYIADYQNHRIRKIANGVITTIAGNGQASFSGDNGPATDAALYLPTDVAVDPGGNVYVADLVNDRIRILTPAGIPCAYSVTPTAIDAPGAGGSVAVNIQAPSHCPWRVFKLPGWIGAPVATASDRSAIVTLPLAPNAGFARTATLTIADTSIQIRQSGPPTIDGPVRNAAGVEGNTFITPGSLAVATGSFFVTDAIGAADVTLPYSLGGLSVQFANAVSAPVYSVSRSQVVFQVPWEMEGYLQGALMVTASGQSSAPQNVMFASAPGIFSVDGKGSGQGAIYDADNRLIDAANPATAGETSIQILCTGLGAVSNRPATGAQAIEDPSSITTSEVGVSIGGAAATVLTPRLAPGAVGVYQVAATVPVESARGDAVPVTIAISGKESNTVTIAVQ